MAYLVSQKRKENDTSTYSESVNVTASTFLSPNTFGGTYTFTDYCLKGSFNQGNVYYLRFKIHQIPQYFYSGRKGSSLVEMYKSDADLLTLQILLKNTSSTTENSALALEEKENPPEVIGTCTVPTDYIPVSITDDVQEYNKYSSYSLVFTPSSNVDTIGFRINRISYDAIYHDEKPTIEKPTLGPRNWLISDNDYTVTVYTGSNDESISSSTKRITGKTILTSDDNGEVSRLKNIIGDNQNWLKFGFQSRPGSLIVVNGQPIRVGRSGIYEINNGTVIKEFMIAAPNGNVDAFLLDYAYKG